MERIMIIGEDLKFCKKLKYDLQDELLKCHYAINMIEGLKHLLRYPYRLVVFESLSSNSDFQHKVEQIRRVCPEILIVVLCPCIRPPDLAAVLKVADNCLTLSCDNSDYKTILESILRRAARPVPPNKNFLISQDGNLQIDPARRLVRLSGRELQLQRRQFDLLYFLTANEGLVFSRDQLHQCVWGDYAESSDHTLSSHMSSLRNKLRAMDNAKEYIRTKYGVGYCFDSLQGEEHK